VIKFIIFYIIFALCTLLSILYIIKQIKRYKTEKRSYTTEELEIDFRMVIRNLMFITIIALIICSELLFSIDNKQKISSGQIGLALASGTLIFYIFFLVWDISKHRIKLFFMNKHNVELRKEVLFGISVFLTISVYAILLLEVVLSIIALIVM
jgi:hypothetical protein